MSQKQVWFDIPVSFNGDLKWPNDSPLEYGPDHGDIHILALTPSILGPGSETRNKLIERAGKGQQIRLLLTGGLASLSWSMHRKKVKDSFEILSSFQQALIDSNCDHRFEARELSWPPSVGMLLVGADVDDGVGSIAVYTPDPKEDRNKKTVLKLQCSQTPDLFKCYRDQFLSLWRKSKPLNSDPSQRYKWLRVTAKAQFQEILDATINYEIAFVIALAEEFREFRDIMGVTHDYDRDPETGFYVYKFEIKERKCVAVLIGAMGHTAASQLVERIAITYSVQTVINIGLSGAMSEDVSTADVVIAGQITNYIENAKARANEGDRFYLDLGGQSFKTTHQFQDEALHLEFAHPELWSQWREECENDYLQAVEGISIKAENSEAKENRLLQAILKGKEEASGEEAIRNLPRNNIKPQIHANDAHIASGPIVGSSKEFVQWLKEIGDRKMLAIDMESGGVVSAANWRSQPLQTFVVRGISDLSDADKGDLEKYFGTSIRRTAMRNACRLVKLILEANLLKRI